MNYYGDCSTIYAIPVFRSDDSGCGLFQILWILLPRPSSSRYSSAPHRCSISYTRYTSLSTPDSALPSRALMHLIVSKPSLQNIHPSSPVAIALSAFGFCYLANTLTIQWRSWRLHKGRKPIVSNRLLNLTTNRGTQKW